MGATTPRSWRARDPRAQPNAKRFLEAHPQRSFGYTRPVGPATLFEQGGPCLRTGFQRMFGDCYALAAYASVLDANPEWIEGMFARLPPDPGHAYSVLGADERGRVILRNPWGWNLDHRGRPVSALFTMEV